MGVVYKQCRPENDLVGSSERLSLPTRSVGPSGATDRDLPRRRSPPNRSKRAT